MVNISLPVPAGFTITTEVCSYYYDNNKKYPKELKAQVLTALSKVEKEMGAKFGDSENPLLLSVRSGARASMPGMMDTILNLGLNDVTLQGLIRKTNNPRFAYDSYRRFVQMYGDVVLGLKPVDKHDEDPFEVILDKKKHQHGFRLDTELTADHLKELVEEFKIAIREKTGHDFPSDPMDQLWGAVGAVFGSWMNERAIVYRKLNNIPAAWGTAGTTNRTRNAAIRIAMETRRRKGMAGTVFWSSENSSSCRPRQLLSALPVSRSVARRYSAR